MKKLWEILLSINLILIITNLVPKTPTREIYGQGRVKLGGIDWLESDLFII